MRFSIGIVFTLASMLIVGCGSNDADKNPVIKTGYKFTFDDLKLWNKSENRIAETDAAYSGSKVAYVDSALQFSLGMDASLADITKDPISQIEISGFVFQKNTEAKGGWVIELNSKDGKQLSWKIAEKDSFLTAVNVWKPFNVVLELNKEELKRKDNYIKSYGWSRNGGELLFDDISVQYK